MAQSQDLLKAIVKEQFFRLGVLVAEAVAAKDASRAALKAPALANYSPEYVMELGGQTRKTLAGKYQTIHASVTANLEKLRAALVDYHSRLDLSSPELANALALIKSVGTELSADTVLAINSQFTNQATLRLLQGAYKSSGAKWDGGIDSLLYETDGAVKKMELAAAACFEQGGSLNTFAVVVGRIAKLEGLEFDQTPDQVGMMVGIRAAAGVPE